MVPTRSDEGSDLWMKQWKRRVYDIRVVLHEGYNRRRSPMRIEACCEGEDLEFLSWDDIIPCGNCGLLWAVSTLPIECHDGSCSNQASSHEKSTGFYFCEEHRPDEVSE